MKAEDYRQLDDERILVMVRLSGRGKASGLEVAQTGSRAATIFTVGEGKVRKLVVYWDGDRALADLGLDRVGDVAGEFMTPRASPSTNEMGETWPVNGGG